MCSPANFFGPRRLRPEKDIPRDAPPPDRDPNDRAGRSYKSATTEGFRNVVPEDWLPAGRADVFLLNVFLDRSPKERDWDEDALRPEEFVLLYILV